MALVKCPECKNKVSSKAKSCPHCGCPVKKKPDVGGIGCVVVLLIIFILIVSFLMGNGSSSSSSTNSKRSYSSSLRTKSSSVKYSIINSVSIPRIKRSLDIRLYQKVSEDALRDLAYKLKNQGPSNYERTFICYYLPDMVVDHGAWATTHFNPDLEVRILGLTKEQERFLLRKEKADPSKMILGQWLDQTPLTSHKTTIYQKNGKFYIEKAFSDGSSGVYDLIEMTVSSVGRRFREKEESAFGDHYVLDKNGDLQSWDNEGYIGTARKVK